MYYVLSKIFPPAGVGLVDEYDVYGTFDRETALQMGIIPFDGVVNGKDVQGHVSDTIDEAENVVGDFKGAQTDALAVSESK